MEGEVICKVNASIKQIQEIASTSKIRIPIGYKLQKGAILMICCKEDKSVEKYKIKNFIIKETHIHVNLGKTCSV